MNTHVRNHAGWFVGTFFVLTTFVLTACTAAPDPSFPAANETATDSSAGVQPTPTPRPTSAPAATPTPTATALPTPTPLPAERLRDAIEPPRTADELEVSIARRELSETIDIDRFSVVGAAVELTRDAQTLRVIDDRVFELDASDADHVAWRYRWLAELGADDSPPAAAELLDEATQFLGAVADAADVVGTAETSEGREFVATIPADALAETAIGQRIGIGADDGEYSLEILGAPVTEIELSPADSDGPTHIVRISIQPPAIEAPVRRVSASTSFDETCMSEDEPNSFVDTSCSDFHTLRIFASYELPALMSEYDYDEAEKRCLEALAIRDNGAGLRPPADEVTMSMPSEAQWDLGRRQVECFLSFIQPVLGPLDDLTVETP